MRIIMLGAPGSGKGTQAEYLIKQLQIPKIATGDMLRAAIAAKTTLGQQVETTLAAGKLVADEIILALIKERLALPDCSSGFLFDGFPRTIGQAEKLWAAKLDVDYIIEIQLADAVIIQRLTGRLVHLPSGRIYHTEFKPPKIANLDDITGEPLIQRADDKKEVVMERLRVYHEQTEPLIAWYQSKKYSGKAKYIQVSGLKSPQDLAQNIWQFITLAETAKEN